MRRTLIAGLAVLMATAGVGLGCGRYGPPERREGVPIPEFLFPGDLGYQQLPRELDGDEALDPLAPVEPIRDR